MDLERLGYSEVGDFVYARLKDFVIPLEPEPNKEFMLFKKGSKVAERLQRKNAQSQLLNEDDSDVEVVDENNNNRLRHRKKYQELKENVDAALSKIQGETIRLDTFKRLYLDRFGVDFKPEKYGFESLELALADLHADEFLVFGIDDEQQAYITYDSRFNFVESRKSSSVVNQPIVVEAAAADEGIEVDEKKRLEEMRKGQADFIQDSVLNNSDLDPCALHKRMAFNQTCEIIVSHVADPCNIHVQLAENKSLLDSLMDDLEKFYFGIGVSVSYIYIIS